MSETRTYVAKFPLVDRAVSFATTIAEPGWWTTEVTQKGRTVTFTTRDAEDLTPFQNFHELLQTVGYHGSDQRRKATLETEINGQTYSAKAPFIW